MRIFKIKIFLYQIKLEALIVFRTSFMYYILIFKTKKHTYLYYRKPCKRLDIARIKSPFHVYPINISVACLWRICSLIFPTANVSSHFCDISTLFACKK